MTSRANGVAPEAGAPETWALAVPPELIEAVARRAAELVVELLAARPAAPPSPYMTVPEAAEFLRCSRQRVDDLLSQRRLRRFKDGARTLVSRAEVEAYLEPDGRQLGRLTSGAAARRRRAFP